MPMLVHVPPGARASQNKSSFKALAGCVLLVTLVMLATPLCCGSSPRAGEGSGRLRSARPFSGDISGRIHKARDMARLSSQYEEGVRRCEQV
jgi:hypothetical protein